MMKKALLVSGLAVALAAGSLPASAHEWHHHHGGNAAGAAMFGLVAGAILGSMANDAYAAPSYYPAYPAYYAPQPVYYGAPTYYYGSPHYYYRHHYRHWHHWHRWHHRDWDDDD